MIFDTQTGIGIPYFGILIGIIAMIWYENGIGLPRFFMLKVWLWVSWEDKIVMKHVNFDVDSYESVEYVDIYACVIML